MTQTRTNGTRVWHVPTSPYDTGCECAACNAPVEWWQSRCPRCGAELGECEEPMHQRVVSA